MHTRDVTAWHLDDLAWIALRKALWEDIELDLDKYGGPTLGDLKQFKKYFLTGTLDPKHRFSSGGGMLLYYAVWLHPDRTMATAQALVEAADQTSIKRTRELLTRTHFAPSFDDVAWNLHELLFLQPMREQAAGLPETVSLRFSAPPTATSTWYALWSWFDASVPNHNPLCRFTVSLVAQLAERSVEEFIASSTEHEHARARLAKQIESMHRIAQSADDPRHEALHALFALLRADKPSAKLSAWLRGQGLRTDPRG